MTQDLNPPAIRRVLFGQHDAAMQAISENLNKAKFTSETADLAICSFAGYDLIVPLTLHDHIALTDRLSELDGRAIIPTAESVRLCNNKLAFNLCMLDSPFAKYIPPVLENPPTIPFILKKRDDRFDWNSRLIQTPGDFAAAAARIASDKYFSQRYIEGKIEHTTNLLLRDGIIRYQRTNAYEMDATHYVRGQQTRQVPYKTIPRTPFADIFTAMLEHAGFHDGTCCFDYKIVDDLPLIFEVNPRFCGYIPADVNRYLTIYA